MNEIRCKIEYPCQWTYKIIGSDQECMESAIAEIVREREYTLNLSRSSEGGKYHSLNLQMNIDDDESRVEIYEALREHPAIKFVL
jgi:putative lipoic acid-binding regulatory protein